MLVYKKIQLIEVKEDTLFGRKPNKYLINFIKNNLNINIVIIKGEIKWKN